MEHVCINVHVCAVLHTNALEERTFQKRVKGDTTAQGDSFMYMINMKIAGKVLLSHAKQDGDTRDGPCHVITCLFNEMCMYSAALASKLLESFTEFAVLSAGERRDVHSRPRWGTWHLGSDHSRGSTDPPAREAGLFNPSHSFWWKPEGVSWAALLSPSWVVLPPERLTHPRRLSSILHWFFSLNFVVLYLL